MNRWVAYAQYLLPKQLLSKIARALGRSRIVWWKNLAISLFRHFYPVNLSEAELTDPAQYTSFNHFFTRALAAHARTYPENQQQLCWPCDGFLDQFGAIQQGELIQAKGRHYSTESLLGHPAAELEGGWFASLYLAPHNYHRVHAPAAARLLQQHAIAGSVFSVGRSSTAYIPQLMARNQRCVLQLHGHQPYYLVMVGALLVSGIEISVNQGDQVKCGGELGRFCYGSTVVILFPPHSIEPDPNLKPGEVQLGDTWGHWISHRSA